MLRVTKPRQMKLVVTLIGLAAFALVIGVKLGGAGNSPTPDELKIEQVCRQAMFAMQTLPVRTGTHDAIITANSVKSTDTSPVTDAQRQALKDHTAVTLAKYYTGDALTKKGAQMSSVIDLYTTTDVRFFGSGVGRMNFTTVKVSGNTAHVSARVEVWEKKAQDQGHGKLVYVTPHSQLDEVWSLVKINNQWYISSESWTFAPVPSHRARNLKPQLAESPRRKVTPLVC